ncbi:MAG: hypothetical protein Q9210_002908 [Variospora velana]
MSLTSILTIGVFITFHIVPALSAPENVIPTKNHRPFGIISRPGAPQSSTPATELSSRLSPEINGIGIGILEWSISLVPDRNFLVTTLHILNDIYDTRPNSTEVAPNYTYKTSPDDFTPNFTALNISAVGQGREVGLPITFDNGALALFVRFLGQMTPRPQGPGGEGRAYSWCAVFGCAAGGGGVVDA